MNINRKVFSYSLKLPILLICEIRILAAIFLYTLAGKINILKLFETFVENFMNILHKLILLPEIHIMDSL